MRFTTVLLLGGMLAFAATGCSDSFNRPAYETVNVGMVEAEIQDILGEPDTAKATWIYRRSGPYRIVVIKFEDGKVVEKTWYDSEDACIKAGYEPVKRKRESMTR